MSIQRKIKISKVLIVLLVLWSQVLSGYAFGQPRSLLSSPKKRSPMTPRSAALQAAEWIRKSRIRSGDTITWPADPDDPTTVDSTLYTGMPGIVLFFLQVYRTTGDKSYLNEAQLGASHLLASLAGEKRTGLYLGIAGIGFVLQETFKVTRKNKYRDGAKQCVQLLKDRALNVGDGAQWGDVTDIISGNSGTGLFLLYAARELNDKSATDLAVKAGQRMIELARPENGGLKWAMSPSTKNLMPNFSHGTAGNAYFLATLYSQTKRKEFLRAALAGARYLKSVAETEGDTCLIFHNEGDGKKLHYLGWCHGPAGTSRLFYRLYQVTGDRDWLNWVEKSARAILKSGIPDKQLPGFWNNVSQCCGTAGVAEFFLDLYKVTHKREYLKFSRRLTHNLLARSTSERNERKWIQAANRTDPDWRIAQTGYMQGAAGIGMWLLHLDSFEHRKQWKIRLPDTPF